MSSNGKDRVAELALQKIDQAIELLGSEERWCKRALKSEDGLHCIVGALQELSAQLPLGAVVLRAIRDVTGERYVGIAAFNDDDKTTHAQVMSALQDARCRVAEGERQMSPARTGWWRRRREVFARRVS